MFNPQYLAGYSQEEINSYTLKAIVESNLILFKSYAEPHLYTNTRKIDLNTWRDARGYTALHISIEYNSSQQIVQYLLSNYKTLINATINNHSNSPFTPMQLAACQGNVIALGLLSAAGSHVDFLGTNGFTPLMLAAHNGTHVAVNKLIELGARLNGQDTNGKTALSYAIEGKKYLVIERLLPLYPADVRQLVCKYAVEQDDAQLFSLLLKTSYSPKENELIGVKNNIKKLLSYKPAKREKNCKKFPDVKSYYQNPDRNLATLTRMLDDAANTSDEDSDYDSDEFQLVQKKNFNSATLLGRGMHFGKRTFTTKNRKQAAQKTYHEQPVYSIAVRELAKVLPETGLDLKKADELVRGYFKLLKLTPNKEERNSSGHKVKDRTGNFQNLYQRFVQAYINSYDNLFTEGGMARNFNFYSSFNPMVSTIPRIENTLKYALGEAVDRESRYLPKLRKSADSKHRRLGFTQIYVIDNDYIKRNAFDVSFFSKSYQLKSTTREG